MDSSKKRKRFESKLKKAKAFLELVGRTTTCDPKFNTEFTDVEKFRSGLKRPTPTAISSQTYLSPSTTGMSQNPADLVDLDIESNLYDRNKDTVKSCSPLSTSIYFDQDKERSRPRTRSRSRSRSATNITNEMEETNNMKTDCTKELKTDEMMSEDVFLEMKMIVRERNKQAMQRPKLYLTPENLVPHQSEKSESQKDHLPPLYLLDLQHLLLYALQGNISSFKPRWCKLLRVTKVSSVVLLSLDGVSYEELLNDEENFGYITQSFQMKAEMICPEQYKSSVEVELLSVPLSISQIKKINQKVPKEIKQQVAIKLKPWEINAGKGKITNEKMSRLCLLLSSEQMKMEGYPMPILTKERQYKDFVFSKDCYSEVTFNSPLYALDCEMCLTTIGRNELTRVSIISENGETIYDTLVKPRNKIINYLTKFSGITKEMMDPVVTVLKDVQRDIKELLPPDAILCGQSLNSDLIALKMFHPYVIDTSVIYNMSGNRSIKAGLRKLSGFFLSRNIQNSSAGHCSAEDAKATLDLVKLKLSKGLEFGDATISGIYFPNIDTYFFGDNDGKKKVNQNLEKDEEDNSRSKSFRQIPKLASDVLSSGSGDKEQGLKRGHDNSNSASNESDSEMDGTSLSECASGSKKRKLSQLEKSNPTGPDGSIQKSPPQERNASSRSTEATLSLSDASWAGSQQQAAYFSQKNSVHIYHSFFKLVNDTGRTSCFIGQPSLMNKYKEEPIEMISASNDSESRRCAKLMVQSKEFVWATFTEYRNALNTDQCGEAEREKIKRKLDHRCRSILKKVKENALVILLLTGRQQGDAINNAGILAKIT